jgi:hypothetical protein
MKTYQRKKESDQSSTKMGIIKKQQTEIESIF